MSIKVNLKIFLFAVIFYLTKQIQIYVLLMIFATLHEFGHLLSGMILGLKPKSLQIMPMGLCVEFSIIPKDYKNKLINSNVITIKKIIIALAGPLTNIIIVIIAQILSNYVNQSLLLDIIYANLIIAVFNLLPIYPLDGGRIIKLLIKLKKGNEVSCKITNIISNISAIILTMISSIGIYYYKNIAILFIILYLWILIILENRRYDLKRRIYKMIESS